MTRAPAAVAAWMMWAGAFEYCVQGVRMIRICVGHLDHWNDTVEVLDVSIVPHDGLHRHAAFEGQLEDFHPRTTIGSKDDQQGYPSS